MKNILFTLIAVATVLVSCNTNKGYQIIGTTEGYSDSTWLFLYHLELEKEIDSVMILNNSFVFTGSVSEPTQFVINTDWANNENFEYKFLWVENTTIKITAQSGDLKISQVSGSAIQDQEELLKETKQSLEERRDSLHQVFNQANWEDTTLINRLRAKQDEIIQLSNEADMAFIEAHPDFLVSAHTLTFLVSQVSKEEGQRLYDLLSNDIKASKYASKVGRYLELSQNLTVGDNAVNFEISDLDGNTVRLDDFKGKYVLLEFWASGCGGCRMENPNLLKNYTEYKQSGFEILSISMDKNKDHWAEAVKKDSMIWTTASNLDGMDGDLAMIYDVNYVPKIYLLDTSGVIIAQDIRGEELGVKLNEIFQQ